MFPALQIGPISVSIPGLVMLVGLWLGLSMAEKHSPRQGVSPGLLYNLVFIALIAGVTGARLVYVTRYPEAFLSSPFSLLSVSLDLLDPLAGLVTGLLAALAYSQRKRASLWSVLDTLTPMFAVLGLTLGVAHLAAGSAFGMPTSLPWAIELWGAWRHPTQVYEIFVAAAILIAIFFIDSRPWSQKPGLVFLSFLALNAASRLFLEAFRGDSFLLAERFRSAQIIAWIILALSLWGLGVKLAKGTVNEDGKH